MRSFIKGAALALAAGVVLAATSVSGIAASEFEGVWAVEDTSGTPFEITIVGDGTASANRSGEGLKGTWKEEGDAVIITWDGGWFTKISKDGDGYKKTAHEKSLSDPPTNTSHAKKVK